jgi:diguanylate cyclase (GGDEF)-like protein
MIEGVGSSQLNRDLVQILQDPRATPGGILGCIAEVRRNHPGKQAFSRFVDLLTGLTLDESAAEASLTAIVRHWDELHRSLGRDPGLPLATFDYFINVDPHLRSPRLVEIQAYQEIERRAETDVLTGLANRRVFSDEARRELRRAGRYGLATALLFVDLDDFKKVNDLWGHQFGDLVLQEVAATLRSAVREVDLLARHGGEEFAVLLPETPKEGALAVGERMRARLMRRFSTEELEGRRLALTLSGGVTSFPDDGCTLDTLIQRADEALYTAKSLGKNRILAARGDRRRSARFPLPAEIARTTLTLAGSDEPGVGGSRALEISRSGALVETECSLRIGSRVRLRFEPAAGSAAPLVVEGRITRRQERETLAGLRFEHGIAFDGASRDVGESLDRLLSGGSTTAEEGRRP